jgi:ribosomal protein S18 acetylase RimI-like enzyme
VAELDGAIVGYLLHHPSYDPDLGGRVTSVVDLYISGSARRRGIGRTLMNAALELCRQAEGRALVWRVRPANRAAVDFYEQLGASVDPGPVSMHLPVARGLTRNHKKDASSR